MRNQPLTSFRVPPRHMAMSRQGGFTIIELLIAMAIIAILAGISFTVLGNAGDRARINSTKTTIAILDEALQDRLRAFNKDLADQERTRKRDNSWGNILQNAAPLVASVGSIDAAMAIVKSDRYRGMFPQRVADTYGLDQSPMGGDDSPLRAKLDAYAVQRGGTFPGSFTNTPAAESSEILYFLITEGGLGIGTDILNNIPSKHIGDTDGDGLSEFLDDWGRPLRFYNAPTALYAPAASFPSGTYPGIQDHADVAVATALMPGFLTANSTAPYDPKGLITVPIDTLPALQFTFNYHHRGLNFVPLIVSVGPDDKLGLFEPNDTSSPTSRLAGVQEAQAALDNVSNLQRTGGQ